LSNTRSSSRTRRSVFLLIAILGSVIFLNGCASMGSMMGAPYKKDNIDRFHKSAKKLHDSLVSSQTDLRTIRESLGQHQTDNRLPSFARITKYIRRVASVSKNMARLASSVKNLIDSGGKMVKKAPSQYTGVNAIHLPAKIGLLTKALLWLKEVPSQAKVLGAEVVSLGKCFAGLKSGIMSNACTSSSALPTAKTSNNSGGNRGGRKSSGGSGSRKTSVGAGKMAPRHSQTVRDTATSSKASTTVSTSRNYGLSMGLQSNSNSAASWSTKGAFSWWLSESFGINAGAIFLDAEASEGFEIGKGVHVSFDLMAIYALRMGQTTRLNLETGVSFLKSTSEVTSGGNTQTGPTALGIAIPVGLWVEHFFTPRITVSVGASFEVIRLLESAYSPEPSSRFFGIDTSQMALRLTWYTD